jgi:hypothetical protein
MVTFSNCQLDDGNHVTSEGEGIKVSMNRLDTLLPEIGTVHLLKIDVEGFEKFVFEGGRRVLAMTNCIYFESSDSLFKRYGYSSSDIFSYLRNDAFTIYRLTNNETLTLIDANYHSLEIENLIAVKHINEFITLTGYKVENI